MTKGDKQDMAFRNTQILDFIAKRESFPHFHVSKKSRWASFQIKPCPQRVQGKHDFLMSPHRML